MMQLLEGQIYQHNGHRLQAAHLCGAWVLKVLDANGEFGIKQPGELAAYRLRGNGEWFEVSVDPDNSDQVVYGATVELDSEALALVATEDEAFIELMGPVAWEW